MPLADLPKDATLVTGIATPGPLLHYLHSQGLTFRHAAYPDHHNFAPHEVKNLRRNSFVFTTEKDFMRLRKLEGIFGSEIPWFYQTIEPEIIDTERFQRKILNYVDKN